ncbi:MAG: Fic family protein, partial [Desulfobacteria bacterium]
EMKRTDIQEALALRHEDYFREAYLIPAITAGMIEMTIPDKPTSSKQKYRVTEKGHDLLTKQKNGAGDNE